MPKKDLPIVFSGNNHLNDYATMNTFPVPMVNTMANVYPEELARLRKHARGFQCKARTRKPS